MIWFCSYSIQWKFYFSYRTTLLPLNQNWMFSVSWLVKISKWTYEQISRIWTFQKNKLSLSVMFSILNFSLRSSPTRHMKSNIECNRCLKSVKESLNLNILEDQLLSSLFKKKRLHVSCNIHRVYSIFWLFKQIYSSLASCTK